MKIEVYSASVGDYSTMNDVVRQIGHVDVLVLCAAYAHGRDLLEQIPLEGMEQSYATNVIGNCNLVKAVLAEPTNKQRIVINVSSFATYRTLPNQSAYGPSKAAFFQMISEFAKEYEESKCRFVSYHPGAIWTELTGKNMPEDIFEGWEDVKLPGDFAVWLASPEADFLHGRLVWAQWDVDELLGLREKVLVDPFFLKPGLLQ